MRTIMMKTARLLLHTALVAALTLPAGAQQGTAPLERISVVYATSIYNGQTSLWHLEA